MSVNIKLQKDYLNVNPACSACLCVNKRAAQMHDFVYYTQATETHVCFQPLPPEHMNGNLQSLVPRTVDFHWYRYRIQKMLVPWQHYFDASCELSDPPIDSNCSYTIKVQKRSKGINPITHATGVQQ